MYCTNCGKQVPAEAAYCAVCGYAQPRLIARRRLVRPLAGRKIAGVCLGVANYLELDVTLVRVIWVMLALIPPVVGGGLAYIVAWILMPNEEPAPAASAAAATPGATAEPQRSG